MMSHHKYWCENGCGMQVRLFKTYMEMNRGLKIRTKKALYKCLSCGKLYEKLAEKRSKNEALIPLMTIIK